MSPLEQLDQLTGAVSLGVVTRRTAVAAERLLHHRQLDDRELDAVRSAEALVNQLLQPAAEPAARPAGMAFLVSEGLEALESYRPVEPDDDLVAHLERVSASLHTIIAGRSAELDRQDLERLRDFFSMLGDLALTHANERRAPVASGRKWIRSNGTSAS
jgi:hypothetical protein